MSSDKYRPGSLVRLLGTELPASRKETKLQAIFSQPAVQSRTQSVSRTLCILPSSGTIMTIHSESDAVCVCKYLDLPLLLYTHWILDVSVAAEMK